MYLKPWQYIERPGAVKNLPPYCMLAPDPDSLDREPMWMVVPDVRGAIEDCPNEAYVEDNYRGYCISVTDHGNVSLLFRFRNGNTREIWGVV